MHNHHPLRQKNLLNHPKQNKTDTMKYSQACLLKKQVDAAIKKLTRTITGPGATDAAQMRLEAAYVSRKKNTQPSYALNECDSKIWRNWRVTPPLWHGTGMWMI